MKRAIITAIALGLSAQVMAEPTSDEMRREIEAEYQRLSEESRVKAEAAQREAKRKAALNAKIEPGALSNYTLSSYPKTYAIWGVEGVARIAEHERKAAEIVAAQRECDRVSYVGLSQHAVPPNRIVVFVDCENRRRYLVGPSEIKSGTPGAGVRVIR